jgi:peptidoglycan/LPS O-acetylase OafA/YrhL
MLFILAFSSPEASPGVYMLFVISGLLMIEIIVGQSEQGLSQFLHFNVDRMRSIIPAP